LPLYAPKLLDWLRLLGYPETRGLNVEAWADAVARPRPKPEDRMNLAMARQ